MKQQTFNQLEKFADNFIDIFNEITTLIMRVFLIGLISMLSGIASKNLIYILNTPLGEIYAFYASYATAGLVGCLLCLYMFNNKIKENK